MKKFLKVTLGVILVIALLFLGVQLIGYIHNDQQRPTEEQLKESERLKQLWEDKKKRDLEEAPIVIPEDATDEEKEALQFRQLKKTLEEVLKPVHLSRFTDYEHEILGIKRLYKYSANEFFIKAEVVWTDGTYFVSRDVLYTLHIKTASISEFEKMSLSDINDYIRSNMGFQLKEYEIFEKENDIDIEFLELLYNQFVTENNFENTKLIERGVFSQTVPGHSQLFFLGILDNETNIITFNRIVVGYSNDSFDGCLQKMKNGEKIKFTVFQALNGEFDWLHLDKLNAQNQSDD